MATPPDYTSSSNESQQIATLLSAGTKLSSEDKQATLPNLIRGSLHSILTLLQKQKDEMANNCVNQGQQLSPEYEEQMTRTTALVREVELVCHEQNLRDQGKEVVLKKPLLTTIYDYDNDSYTENKVKSNDMRNVKEFDGEESPTDIKAETFLNEVVSTGRQCKLNNDGLKALLMARLAGVAKQIVISHLELHRIQLEDLSFSDLVGLMEHYFCPLSQPRQALVQLQQLPKLQPNDFSFLKLQATVSRLAKISTLEVPEQHRDVLLQTRALDSFQNCLQPHHKALIIAENQKRHNQGMGNLTLSGVTQFLIQQTTMQTSDTPLTMPYSTSTVRQASHQPDPVDENNEIYDDYGQTYYVNRGRGRASFRPNSRFPRGPRFSSRGRAGPQNQPANPNVNRNQFPPRFPNVDNFQNTTPNRYPRQRGRGVYFTPKRENPQQLTNHQMGVANKACWKCGMLSHNAYDPSCYFRNYPLTKMRCKNCQTGLHHYTVCVGNNQEAQEAFKRDIEKSKQQPNNRFYGKQQREVKPEIQEIDTPDYNDDLEEYLKEIQQEN